MKKTFTILIAAIAAILMMAQPGKVWATTDQVTSQTATNNGEYVIAIYYSGDYYALPGASTITASNTYSGTKLTLNTLGKVNTSDAAGITWKLVEGTTSGQFKIQQTIDNTTKYLIKSGTTGSTNYKINTNTTAELWEFTQQSDTYHTYSVKSLKTGATANLYLTNNSSTFGVYGSTSSGITLIAVGDAQAFTVTLADDNSTLPEASAGAGVTLPSRSNVGPYTFAGWSATTCGSQETTTAPASIIPAGTYHPTANITLYPVYTRTEGGGTTTGWQLTDLDDADAGVYALLTEDYHAFNGSISSGHGGVTTNTFSFTNSVATEAPTGVCEITFTAVTENNAIVGYTMYNSGSGKGYLYASKAASGGLAWHSSETSYWKYVVFNNEDNWQYQVDYSSSKAILRGYSNSSFRTYATNNGVTLKLAKKVTVSTGTTYYISVVSTGTPSITAANVEILYSATGGSIEYSINEEPDPAGSLTAAIKNGSTITNLTLGTITDDEVPFTCGANNELSAAHTATVTLTYTYGNDETVTKDVTITQAAHLTPSITANNVNINYNSTGGNIAYTINDGIEGGSVSASVPNNSWVTLSNNFASPIAFTCEDTEGVVARTETVTLTYTYNTNQTVTKEVTVTQTVDPDLGTSTKPYTVAQARTFIDGLNGATSADGKHVSGIISQVDSYNGTYYSITYWISDDGTTNNQLQVYSGKGIDGANFSAETDVAVGAEVVVKGKLKYYSSQSVYEFDYNNELVTYTAPVVPNPTITIAAGLENYITTDPEDDAAAGTTVQIGIFPPNDQVLKTLTVTKANEETVDVSPAVSGLVTDYTFNMPASNVTISATFVDESTTTTILYSVNGVDEEVMLYTTTGYELPTLTSSQIPEGFDFAGWTLDEKQSPIVLLDENYVPENNDILIAVFSREEGAIPGDFTKVTSTQLDWSGDYLIVAVGVYANSDAYSVAFDGSLTTLDAANNTIDVEIDGTSIKGNKINSKSVFTIAAITDNEQITGWSIRSASGYYIGRTANGNGMNSDQETVYSHSLSIDDDKNAVITSSAGPVMRYNKNASDKRFRYYGSGQQPIMLFKQGAGTSGEIKYYTHIIPSNPVIAGNVTISGPTIIESGTILDMGSYDLTSNNATNLVIEDGAQLIVHNDNVKATVKKALPEAAASKDQNWTTIASPVKDINIGNTGETGDVLHLKDVDFALYRFNETIPLWENYKNTAYHGDVDNKFESLESGRGYLYSRTSLATLEYVGEVNGAASVTYSLTISDNDNAGFHLIGNPYSHDIYKGDKGKGCAIENSSNENTYVLATGFYQLKNGTSWTPQLEDGTKIEKGEGILVQATTAGTLSIKNTNAAPAKANHDNIMFTVANGQYEDVTYALFDKGVGLSKINHRDADAPMLYIPQNGENFAIAMMNDDTQTFGLNFKAATTGKYTLKLKANGNFSYLHVIDRMTGEDVDMLLEGEYSFIGSSNDNDNRFIVRLSYLPDYGEENGIFAYQSGSDIYVSGEGELQVFDVTGRFVMSEHINGATSINADALSKGVYVLRIVGTEIKTQKIVVR